MFDPRRVQVITFDCYGTLIDWESGILEALAPLRAASPVVADDARILSDYATLESALEGGTYLTYREVLRGVMRGLASRLSVPRDAFDVDVLVESLPDWAPFDDTVESLRRLGAHARLGVVSNIDDDLFFETARRLGVPFDYVITAQQVESYKPAHANFRCALERIGIPKEHLLHAAQSRFHDIAPTRALGITSVWVNRRSERPGGGATAGSAAVPDLEVPDLRTLADLFDRARSQSTP